jgi:hypothetical protein
LIKGFTERLFVLWLARGRRWLRPAGEPQRGQRPSDARQAARRRAALDDVQISCFLILIRVLAWSSDASS